LISFVIAPVLLWFYPRIYLLGVAALLPVAEYWAFHGLASPDRDGFENWGLLALPAICLLSAGLGAFGLVFRRGRDDRRRERANGP
jgi:hypothetical protein